MLGRDFLVDLDGGVQRARERRILDHRHAARLRHFAVALKYDRGMNAPLCVAKGMDAIALKIREVAQASGVPVVENPPLARALHATVEIDQEIPAEHYQAVAEVIGYVMKLNRAAGAARAGR